jgi:hypothetical protein
MKVAASPFDNPDGSVYSFNQQSRTFLIQQFNRPISQAFAVRF